MLSSKCYSKSYYVEVAYRDASTGWRWMKRRVLRSMESYPWTKPKRAKTVSADDKHAQALTAKLDIHIADELGQTPK